MNNKWSVIVIPDGNNKTARAASPNDRIGIPTGGVMMSSLSHFAQFLSILAARPPTRSS